MAHAPRRADPAGSRHLWVDSHDDEHSLLAAARFDSRRRKYPSIPKARKVSDLYSSYMNEARVERLGIKPLQAELQLAAGIKHVGDIGPFDGAP